MAAIKDQLYSNPEDASNFLASLQSEPGMFVERTFDSLGRLENVFWATVDQQNKIARYGACIQMDTTVFTNRYLPRVVQRRAYVGLWSMAKTRLELACCPNPIPFGTFVYLRVMTVWVDTGWISARGCLPIDRYGCPLLFIVGVDDENRSCILAQCLLRSECTETFEWILTSWDGASGGRRPKV